jgi:predicted GNAT family N-acyltransferase
VRSDILLAPLREQILDSEPELLETQLREFRCIRDTDVEAFIQNRAIDYEESGLSRTFLYLGGDDEKVEIVAYFTLALTSVNFTGISGKKRQKVLGRTPGRDSQDHFAGLLVGQFARCDGFDNTVISGTEMMHDCEGVIEEGRKYFGGKVLYLDCREHLRNYYERYGFLLLNQTSTETGLYKMFKVLPKLSR